MYRLSIVSPPAMRLSCGAHIPSSMSFTYFADPLAFAFMAEPDTECYFCRSTEGCLDGYCLKGVETVEAVCLSCLREGRLKDLEIAANEINHAALDPGKCDPQEVADEITYRTPSLPTWQDGWWPVKGGRACRFVKIASKQDYLSKEEFLGSLHDCENDDMEELWGRLPEHAIRNLKEGQDDVSFYLFDDDGVKVTVWDAN
ncbi:MAG: hypothetical protein EOP85_10480 [Verrucomicrobiaceae bacterium]|nr:MAG: hypothetical protein EOP85_10480 [Verrucomicrobiaceae bacterium]